MTKEFFLKWHCGKNHLMKPIKCNPEISKYIHARYYLNYIAWLLPRRIFIGFSFYTRKIYGDKEFQTQFLRPWYSYAKSMYLGMYNRWRFKNKFSIPIHQMWVEVSWLWYTLLFCSIMPVECTNPNLKSALSAQLGQSAPKLELDLYIPQT